MSGDWPTVSPLSAALSCRCPRCGEGKVFQGILTVVPRCSRCGLDLRGEDVGDGATVFVILILGALVVLAAIIVEVKYEPPLWLHLVLWIPTILVGAVLLLRPLKAGLIALQYRHHLLEAEKPR